MIEEPRDRVARLYDAKAPTYDTHFQRSIDLAEDAALYGWLRDDVHDRHVLDVACGTGVLLDHLTPRRWLGIDISCDMIAQAVRRIEGADIRSAGARVVDICQPDVALGAAPRYGDLSFDVAVCLWAWPYFSDPEVAMNNIKNALKVNGRFYLHNLEPRYARRPHYILNGASLGLYRAMTLWQVCALAEHVGLEVEDVKGLGYVLDPPLLEKVPVEAQSALHRALARVAPARAATQLITLRRTRL
jgi:SAM-dependent methyltransferase